MPKPIRTKPVSGAQVRADAGKAEEYADTAASEIEAGRHIAATSALDRAQRCVAVARTVAAGST